MGGSLPETEGDETMPRKKAKPAKVETEAKKEAVEAKFAEADAKADPNADPSPDELEAIRVGHQVRGY